MKDTGGELEGARSRSSCGCRAAKARPAPPRSPTQSPMSRDRHTAIAKRRPSTGTHVCDVGGVVGTVQTLGLQRGRVRAMRASAPITLTGPTTPASGGRLRHERNCTVPGGSHTRPAHVVKRARFEAQRARRQLDACEPERAPTVLAADKHAPALAQERARRCEREEVRVDDDEERRSRLMHRDEWSTLRATRDRPPGC
jgi:hypothetical protein